MQPTIPGRTIPEPAIRGWRLDPDASEKNDCEVWRLDHCDQTALMSRHDCPERGPGWRVQVGDQRAYHYSDRLNNLYNITANVKRDIEKLNPVIVIEKADDDWCICPGCDGNAVEIGYLKGTDCPKCGRLTAADAIRLARRRQRRAEEEAEDTKQTK